MNLPDPQPEGVHPDGWHIDADGTHHIPGTISTGLGQSIELGLTPTPLLSIARERRGQDVDVHIAGGLTVTGRLTAVNDDETITVVDKARRYDIALGSVAVIEGSKS